MRLNPVQIELRYQELKNQLKETHSIRFRYRMFRDFALSLGGSYSSNESYLSELISELPLFSRPVTWSGILPAELEEQLDIFIEIENSLDDPSTNKYLHQIICRLHHVCILMYACLNEMRSVDEHLHQLMKSDTGAAELLIWKMNSNTSGVQHLFQLLEQLIRNVESQTVSWIPLLKELMKDSKLILNENDGNILVPVAERYVLQDEKQVEYGRLRNLSVEAVASRKHNDDLAWDFRVYGAEYVKNEHFSQPAEAARKLVSKKTSKLENSFYKGILSYELTGAAHQGSSANLAVSALWFTELLKKAELRKRYILNSATAITGDIDSDGRVQPVDPGSIELKVQGAFFSWCTDLVVPYEQIQLFEKKRNQLQKKFPGRNLELIPVKYLRDIFYDRRVAILKQSGRIAHTVKQIWQKRYNVVSVSIILLLITIIFGLVHGPIDKNPATIFFDEEYLVLTNSNGFELNRIRVDRETADYQNDGFNLSRKPLALLHDITGDGINEVIWATRGSWEAQNTSKVHAYSASGDSLIWSHEFMQNAVFPRQSAFLNTGLRTHQIGVVELDESDIRLVTSNDTYIYFPSTVKTFNVQTGELLSTYIHIGQLRDMLLADLTGNGIEEIVLTGVNNAFWNAAIVVLDPANATGHSPLTTDYKPNDTQPANELFYILVPKSVIGDYVNPVEKYNRGDDVSYDVSSGRLFFRISEGMRVFRDQEQFVSILAYFDREMKPAGVGTSDTYDIIARELYEQGDISLIPDYDYFEAFQDSILYWNGVGFVKRRDFFK